MTLDSSHSPSPNISTGTSPVPDSGPGIMYRSNSPIFDVPEFPPLRRVKPLPKRRRTSLTNESSPPRSANTSLHDPPNPVEAHLRANGTHGIFTLPALPPISPNATTEELIAHAEELSAQMALQSYYMPILGGVQDFIKNEAGGIMDRVTADANANGNGSAIHFSGQFGYLEGGDVGEGFAGLDEFRRGLSGGGGRDDEDDRDGDYVDHLPQRGNTKKRKVPANLSGSPRGADSVDGQSGGEEDGPSDRGIPVGAHQDADSPDGLRSSVDDGGGGGLGGGEGGKGVVSALLKQGRMPGATLVGLQHKEMLKSRKRQLAAVLGALTHGDTLALDQALSAHYPLLKPSTSSFGAYGGELKDAGTRLRGERAREESRLRTLKRKAKIAQRSAAALALQDGRADGDDEEKLPPPEGDFTFSCPSKTSIRLVETRKEVAELHARFEAELSRQAAKAAEAAKQAAAAAAAAAAHASKKAARVQQKAARTSNNTNSQVTATHPPPSLEQLTGTGEQTIGGGAKGRGKKKKRSALANASNPHHLRNYVPSRLPNQGQTNAAQAQANAQNYVSPLPLRFLSAQVPPRRRGGKNDRSQSPPSQGKNAKDREGTPVSQLVNPIDEWICPFCEYQLFYGDDASYRRAVRNRKKILKRRRRARERAAAAASGNSAPAGRDRGAGGDEDEDEEYEPEPVAPVSTSKHGASGRGRPGGAVGDGDGGGDVHAGR